MVIVRPYRESNLQRVRKNAFCLSMCVVGMYIISIER